jgi:hypothetical protein
MTALGATALGFTSPDAIFPGILIWGVMGLFGLKSGSPIAIALVTLVLVALVIAAAYFFSRKESKPAEPVVLAKESIQK